MKLPFTFAAKFLLRMFIPGVALALFAFPTVSIALELAGAKLDFAVVFVVSTPLFGWLLMILDMQIYMLYEGRRFWPHFIFDLMRKREEARLKRVRGAAYGFATREQELYRGASRSQTIRYALKYKESWVDLRRFPMNEEGDFEAVWPTRLGNLVDAFERYSERTYGLDSIFFWPRIWLRLDKDTREDIDTQQAFADSTIYLSFGLFVSSLLLLFYFAISFVPQDLFGSSQTAIKVTSVVLREVRLESWYYAIAAMLAALAGYTVYRLGLEAQAKFGETFKAVFDQFGGSAPYEGVSNDVDRIHAKIPIDREQRIRRNRALWNYLHNFSVSSPFEEYSPGFPDVVPVSFWNDHCLHHKRNRVANREEEPLTAGEIPGGSPPDRKS